MEENKMKKHITVAGILQIVFGAFNLLGAVALIFVFGFVDGFIDDPIALKVLDLVSIPLIVILLVVSIAIIVGAIALLACKPWGKILTLVMAGLGLLNIPFGTLKGVYIIWVLVQPETNALFAKNCAETPAA